MQRREAIDVYTYKWCTVFLILKTRKTFNFPNIRESDVLGHLDQTRRKLAAWNFRARFRRRVNFNGVSRTVERAWTFRLTAKFRDKIGSSMNRPDFPVHRKLDVIGSGFSTTLESSSRDVTRIACNCDG